MRQEHLEDEEGMLQLGVILVDFPTTGEIEPNLEIFQQSQPYVSMPKSHFVSIDLDQRFRVILLCVLWRRHLFTKGQ